MSNVAPTTILCIDDDPVALVARSLVLSIAGYDVLTAPSGDAALRILSHRKIDLVITDDYLPGATGAEIALSLKQLNPAILVVLLTGGIELPRGSEQADLVLVKGMSPDAFLTIMEKLLGEGAQPAADDLN